MSSTTAALLGATAGLTIFLGLPVARVRGLDVQLQGFLNAAATGVLVFLLVDILGQANGPVKMALDEAHQGQLSTFVALLTLYVGGLAAGPLGLTWFNRYLASRLGRGQLRGPGAAVAAPSASVLSPRSLALTIAIGLGMHNFSEGLAIGQAASAGALTFTGVLVIGFGLHNITEGFGVAAPLASRDQRPTWAFLCAAGLIGGGPTFVGTVIGYSVVSRYAFVLFLALAGGALIYLLNEMFGVCRKLNTPTALAAGVLVGFLAGFGTDLVMSIVGG